MFDEAVSYIIGINFPHEQTTVNYNIVRWNLSKGRNNNLCIKFRFYQLCVCVKLVFIMELFHILTNLFEGKVGNKTIL